VAVREVGEAGAAGEGAVAKYIDDRPHQRIQTPQSGHQQKKVSENLVRRTGKTWKSLHC
jgi:hypothetical protein